jgi:tetratricopeptide (TPR) repeat protein
VREAIQAAAARGDKRTEWLATVQHVSLKNDLEPESWTTDDVRRTAEQALAVFEELGDDLGLARAWDLMGAEDWAALRQDAAAKAFEKGLAYARRSTDERAERDLVGSLIGALYYGSTPAPEGIERIGELMKQAGSRSLEARALGLLAGLHTMQRRFEEARSLYDRCKAMHRELGTPTFQIAKGTMHAREIHLLAGDAEGAERELRWGYETLTEVGEKPAALRLPATSLTRSTARVATRRRNCSYGHA